MPSKVDICACCTHSFGSHEGVATKDGRHICSMYLCDCAAFIPFGSPVPAPWRASGEPWEGSERQAYWNRLNYPRGNAPEPRTQAPRPAAAPQVAPCTPAPPQPRAAAARPRRGSSPKPETGSLFNT